MTTVINGPGGGPGLTSTVSDQEIFRSTLIVYDRAGKSTLTQASLG